MAKIKRSRWTETEEKLLKEYSQKYLAIEIAEKLNKDYRSVKRKAIKMGIKLQFEEDPWTNEKIEYLKTNVKKQSLRKISEYLGISVYKIVAKCEELNIDCKKSYWTEEEINILRENAQKCHYTELVKVLPNRSLGAISAKAFELGIETISQYHKRDERVESYIKENWGKLSVSEIARNLEVSVSVVYRYKKELGLPDTGQLNKKWNSNKIESLRKDAKILTRNELAKKYATTPEQISSVAKKYNIKLIDSKRIWNDNLDKKLLELADTDLSINEIAQQMELKASAIRNRLRILDIDKYERKIAKMWSEEKVKKLIELNEIKNPKEIAQELNVTEKQVYYKIRSLNLKIKREKQREWSEEENKTLLKLSPIYERHMIAKIMERNEGVIKEKAKILGIHLKIRESQRWSLVEEQLLREYAKEFTSMQIGYLLDRSEASVRGKLKTMNLKAQLWEKYWSENEINQLIELANNHSEEEIASIMNKTFNQVRAKLYSLGLKAKSNSNKYWTIEEEIKLKELLEVYSTFDIAEILNRSEEAVVNRAIKLKYEITTKNRKWDVLEEQHLIKIWGKKPIEKIAEELDRTPSAIINRAYKLYLGAQIENNYDGFTISELEKILGCTREKILTNWVTLGLKLNYRKRSEYNKYAYVTKKDLLEFLENNKDIWNSCNLEIGILGEEPRWLIEKRKYDLENYKICRIQKQQLIQANNYFLQEEQEIESSGYKLSHKNNNRNG